MAAARSRTRRNPDPLVEATGEDLDYLLDLVGNAYRAKFKGAELPEGISFRNVESAQDPNPSGRPTRFVGLVHFDVARGSTVLGSGTYKPNRRSIWIDWTRAV